MEQPSFEDFLALNSQEISLIVKKLGKPAVGVYASDGNRRVLKLFEGFEFDDHLNYEKMIDRIATPRILSIFFDHGLKTLIVPIFSHGNFVRMPNEEIVNYYLLPTIRKLTEDTAWLSFYEEKDIRVKFYGDFRFAEESGLVGLADRIDIIEKLTSKHSTHLLLFGIACSNYYELPRLVTMAIESFQANNSLPSRNEIVKLYYGEEIGDVDFFLRATSLRDSDVQPLLVSGKKTQFYFLVAPDFISITPKLIKAVFYDLMYARDVTMSQRAYNVEDLSEYEKEYLREFYQKNREKVIGLGKRIGSFWIPMLDDLEGD